MSCLDCFESTLCYTAPSHGDWGIVRIATEVPQTHLLFVAPAACGRHGALGAIQHGFKDKVSYLAITREDIISGYDALVEQAVDELLRRRHPTPRAVMIFVSCLDDLIGTDLDSLCLRLHAAHPNVEFQSAHMNPITLDSKKPPMVTTQSAMYAYLHPTGHDNGVNLIGNLGAIDPHCELFDVLSGWGCTPARHLLDFDTFDGYQSMARSRLNILMSPIASLAASQMQTRLDIPYTFLPVTYDPDEIAAEYDQLASALNKSLPDMIKWRDAAISEMEITRTALSNRPVWITAGSVMKPFGLARTLLKAGFNVETVVAQTALPIDSDALKWVRREHPNVRIIQPQHVNVIEFAHRSPDSVAIGFDAAYIAGAKRVVSITNDEGMFGYRGMVSLMRMLRSAAAQPCDLKQLIDDYGVVI